MEGGRGELLLFTFGWEGVGGYDVTVCNVRMEMGGGGEYKC